MADFLTGIWDSVFAPGVNAPLMRATNMTFAALQTLLFVLLLATRSVHLVVMSFLCGAVWASLRWFVAQLDELKAKEGAAATAPAEAGKSSALPEGMSVRRVIPAKGVGPADTSREETPMPPPRTPASREREGTPSTRTRSKAKILLDPDHPSSSTDVDSTTEDESVLSYNSSASGGRDTPPRMSTRQSSRNSTRSMMQSWVDVGREDVK